MKIIHKTFIDVPAYCKGRHFAASRELVNMNWDNVTCQACLDKGREQGIR